MNRRRPGPLPLDEIRRRLIPHQRSRRPTDFELWTLATIADDTVQFERCPPPTTVRRFSLV